ncbi:HEPACAM family member 2 [Paramisgurnus dabryanus]|uniref:HEPACAM family member 2 n=1 Tax=Paramisgurnus dabryanus TaxID=90735 RepID=UPI0031F3D8AF
MECVGGTMFLLMCTLFLAVHGMEYISLESTQHGRLGGSMLLKVEPRFDVQHVKFQGAWYKIKPNYTLLVTFTDSSDIQNIRLKNKPVLSLPDVSLYIEHLDEDAEGEYKLEINFIFPGSSTPVAVTKIVTITVSVPVSKPILSKSPEAELIEERDNVTLTCSVESGTNVQYTWMKDNIMIVPSERHMFSEDHGTVIINPVSKDDMGQYTCEAKNYISREVSDETSLSVYYGPYNLAVNSEQGLKTGGVFTVNPGELVFFECLADSNPPNSCVWISKTTNGTEVVMTGTRFEVTSYELAQAKEFWCRAFNNVTKKQDETKFTLVVARFEKGTEKHFQEGSALSPLTFITVSSVVIIICMMFVFLRKSCHSRRISTVMNTIYRRPMTEQRGLHRSGHEDATEDFGIYEFVSVPGKMESTQASCRSLARLDSVKDLHTTIYDVIRHVPETPTLSLLK